ncbi:hypothetical protein J6590_003710 [Homalodisca vitripennis]|nr:hypothetical protein J6590_003710 [Homalodisca vitripennis]
MVFKITVKFRIDKAIQEEDALAYTSGFKRWKLKKYWYLLGWNIEELVAELSTRQFQRVLLDPLEFSNKCVKDCFLNAEEELMIVKCYENCLKQFFVHFNPKNEPVPKEVKGTAFHFYKRFFIVSSVMDYHPSEIIVGRLARALWAGTSGSQIVPSPGCRAGEPNEIFEPMCECHQRHGAEHCQGATQFHYRAFLSIIGDKRRLTAPILIMHICLTAIEHSNPFLTIPSLITSSSHKHLEVDDKFQPVSQSLRSKILLQKESHNRQNH